MDFDSPAAAQKAVTALKSSGVQAQMAKVRLNVFIHLRQVAVTPASALLTLYRLLFILVTSSPHLPPSPTRLVPALVYVANFLLL